MTFAFDDFSAGQTFDLGTLTVDETEMLEFSRRYDPQPFHIDSAAAAAGMYGGLIASGWQTVAVTMRMLVDHVLSPASSLGSPGCDELRWTAPVRPGDSLAVRIEILSTRRSRSKPDRGLVSNQLEVLNQRDEVVLTLKTVLLLKARHPEPPTAA